MKKTIIDIQELAQMYLEDEVLMFEINLLNIKEEMSEESKPVRNITGYLESLYDDFEIHDYSEIQKDIEKYIGDEDFDRNSVYFKLLEKKFADVRIASLNAMLGLCHGKPFKYNISQHDLNTGIENFKLNDTIQKLLLSSTHKKPKTRYVQEAIYKLAKTIKTEFKNKNKKINKKSLAGEIHKTIKSDNYKDEIVKNAKLTVENIERKYLKGWKDI